MVAPKQIKFAGMAKDRFGGKQTARIVLALQEEFGDFGDLAGLFHHHQRIFGQEIK